MPEKHKPTNYEENRTNKQRTITSALSIGVRGDRFKHLRFDFSKI